jgi:hypothetical protein
MSQQLRRVLAAVSVTAALLLAVAAPSRAAGFREPASSGDIMSRVWSWMESLLPGVVSPAAPHQRPAGMLEKTTTSGGTTPMPIAPSPGAPGQGNMIDPEGAK